MRFIFTLFLVLIFFGPVHAAEKSQSWREGAWTEERMAKYEDFQLFSWGSDYLNGWNVTADSNTAEILFTGYVNKNSGNAIHVGVIYLNYSDNFPEITSARLKSFEWLGRALKSNQNEAKKWLGVLMRLVGLEIQRRQLPTDPPNIEASSWLLAASKFNDRKAALEIILLKKQFSDSDFQIVRTKSDEIIDEPANSYIFLTGIKVSPEIK